MPVLDKYLEALHTPGAQALTFRAGGLVELTSNGSTRPTSKSIRTAEQILALLREVLPRGFRDATGHGPRGYYYLSTMGPVLIEVALDGADVTVRVSPWRGSPPTQYTAPGAIATPVTGDSVVSAVAAFPNDAPVPSLADFGLAPGGFGSPTPPVAAPAPPARARVPVGVQTAPMPAVMPAPAPTPAALRAPPAPAISHASAAATRSRKTSRPPRAREKSNAGSRARTFTIEDLFEQMIELGASDLHLKPGRPPMVRVEGELREADGRGPLSVDDVWGLVEPILPPRNRQALQEKYDTDFAFQLGQLARFRCNVYGAVQGVSAAFRRIVNQIPSAREIGLPPSVLRLCDYKKGLILITGASGSGKSTTLATMIDYINEKRRDHILTIEDPVEIVHQDKGCLIHQREIGESARSFSSALRAALREDPDVVLIGELRDLETTAMALETAETGHLVLATLHTNSAAATVDRIINQFPADRQPQIRAMLADSLIGAVSQVLCKKKSGGRIAAFEVLVVTSAISNLIREEKTFQIPSLMQTSRSSGMQSFNEALVALVRTNHVAPVEAWAQAIDKKEMGLALTRAGYAGAWSEQTS